MRAERPANLGANRPISSGSPPPERSGYLGVNRSGNDCSGHRNNTSWSGFGSLPLIEVLCSGPTTRRLAAVRSLIRPCAPVNMLQGSLGSASAVRMKQPDYPAADGGVNSVNPAGFSAPQSLWVPSSRRQVRERNGSLRASHAPEPDVPVVGLAGEDWPRAPAVLRGLRSNATRRWMDGHEAELTRAPGTTAVSEGR